MRVIQAMIDISPIQLDWDSSTFLIYHSSYKKAWGNLKEVGDLLPNGQRIKYIKSDRIFNGAGFKSYKEGKAYPCYTSFIPGTNLAIVCKIHILEYHIAVFENETIVRARGPSNELAWYDSIARMDFSKGTWVICHRSHDKRDVNVLNMFAGIHKENASAGDGRHGVCRCSCSFICLVACSVGCGLCKVKQLNNQLGYLFIYTWTRLKDL